MTAKLLVLLALPATVSGEAPGQVPGSGPAPTAPIFRFAVDSFWLNLHQFLYVLGRAELKAPDVGRRAVAGAPAEQERELGSLPAEEQRSWREAVSLYAFGPSKLDAVFDEPLIVAGNALVRAEEASLAGSTLEAPMRDALERAAPIYRRVFWPRHRAANAAWVAEVQALLDRHGAPILSFLTRAYGLPWPADGYPVQVSGYANWAGAFSTRGNLLVISSLDAGNRGSQALETVFHEAMHQWDDPLEALLAEAARAQGATVPEGLSHAMIFFTAGEAVRRVVPDHVPYAEANGLWRRRMGGLKPALEAAWRPYLDGQGTREEALAALLRQFAPTPAQPAGSR